MILIRSLLLPVIRMMDTFQMKISGMQPRGHTKKLLELICRRRNTSIPKSLLVRVGILMIQNSAIKSFQSSG